MTLHEALKRRSVCTDMRMATINGPTTLQHKIQMTIVKIIKLKRHERYISLMSLALFA